MRRVCFLLLALLAMPIMAMTDAIKSALDNPQQVGQGRFTYYFWDVYDATLFASGGQYNKSENFALKLDYLRDLEGKKIARRSIKEMKKQGVKDKAKLDQWSQDLERIFPDVSEGDSLTGIAHYGQKVEFFFNGEQIGQIEDPAFVSAFFDIWLSDKTSEPELRDQLLGKD